MNTLIETIFSRSRLSVGLALMLSIVGVATWLSMPRQEDPTMKARFGLVIAPYPGANPLDVERLVALPLEEELSELSDIERVQVTIRTGIAIVNIRFRSSVMDTQRAWEKVRRAIQAAHREMPKSAILPTINQKLNETEAVVVALRGPNDVLVLAEYADKLKSKMMAMNDVSRVEITGDAGEQISISIRESVATKLGLSHVEILQALTSRNLSSPGGIINIGERRIELKPNSEFRTLEEIRRTPIFLRSPGQPSGAMIPLEDIAEVRAMVAQPLTQRARLNGEVAVFVGVVPRRGLDAIRFGKSIQKEIDTFAADNPKIQVENLAFQPKQVEDRLQELGGSLLLGILIVGLLLIMTMGFRLGLVVSSVVPLVTFATIGIYGALDGVFHQIAAAALVLALGMLVDNAIVMAELVQSNLDAGLDRRDAMLGAVKELFIPLLSSTATTVAAFVPMLLAPGTTGEFTRSIPVVAIIALTVSYGFAVIVTPVFSGLVLRPNISQKDRPQTKGAKFTKKLARVSVQHPVWALLFVATVVLLSGSLAPKVKKDFFPQSDKKHLIVMMTLPEGTNLDTTNEKSKILERFLMEHELVESVAAFVGRSTPRFYYNLPLRPNASHMAQLVVKVSEASLLTPLISDLRVFSREKLVDALVLPKRLEQGPPVAAPVEIRLLGNDLQDLFAASEKVRKIVREIEGSIDIRADHGLGKFFVEYEIDDAAASRLGLARASVVRSMYGRTVGLPAGKFHKNRTRIPIQVRSFNAANSSLAQVDAFELSGPAGRVPLSRITQSKLKTSPAVIHRFNGVRRVSVLTDILPGRTYAEIISELLPQIENMTFPEGVKWEIGGASEASADANKEIGKNAPLAFILLLVILLAQFNSFRRTLIVLLTAPMAILGIWPGLYLGGLAFGFIALLGAIALIGIVVNGAIVLLDVIELERNAGAKIPDAIEAAIMRRTRPILLTTLTTIAGLMPLLFSKSTLWPPMASAMISGLTIATVLTLVAVPASYRLLFRSETNSDTQTRGDGE